MRSAAGSAGIHGPESREDVKSVKNRIAAKKAAKASAAPSETSRALRFTSAGQVDDVESDQDASPTASLTSASNTLAAATFPDPDPDPDPVALAVSPATQSRSSRFAASIRPIPAAQSLESQSSRPVDSKPARQLASKPPQDQEQKPTAWDDPDRPAGSRYSKEEWDAAEEASPGMIVFEMLKADERALVAKVSDAMDVVLKRSLLVQELTSFDWKSHASAVVEHHGEFGKNCYQVIRSQTEREKYPWADGSKLVIRNKGFEEQTPNQNQAKATSRTMRFRA